MTILTTLLQTILNNIGSCFGFFGGTLSYVTVRCTRNVNRFDYTQDLSCFL